MNAAQHFFNELEVYALLSAVIVVAVIAVQPFSLHQATPGLIGAQFWKAQGMTSNPMCFDFAMLLPSLLLPSSQPVSGGYTLGE